MLMELLVMHMEEPCFDFLRTKHSLGYHVYPMCRCTSQILGLSINVSYQSSKHSTSYVESRIEEFLCRYEISLRQLTQDDFKSQVDALVSLKRCEDPQLGHEVQRHWEEVTSGQLLFSRVQREVEALTSLRCEELSEFFSAVRSHGRSLSVHVIGSSEVKGEVPERSPGEGQAAIGLQPPSLDINNVNNVNNINNVTAPITDNITDVTTDITTITPITPITTSPITERVMVITDIQEFRSQLPLYDYHKIIA
ncbi:nardilysin-like [Lampetra planeri]